LHQPVPANRRALAQGLYTAGTAVAPAMAPVGGRLAGCVGPQRRLTPTMINPYY